MTETLEVNLNYNVARNQFTLTVDGQAYVRELAAPGGQLPAVCS